MRRRKRSLAPDSRHRWDSGQSQAKNGCCLHHSGKETDCSLWHSAAWCHQLEGPGVVHGPGATALCCAASWPGAAQRSACCRAS